MANDGRVQIENRLPVEIDITLTDGTNLSLTPREKGKDNLSEPVLRKLLPHYLNKMVAKGDIRIIAS